MMSLHNVCDAVNGQVLGSDVLLKNISINTREDCEGRLFVALKGDNFDAHDYLNQAAAAGAKAVMVERQADIELPQIVVDDSHQALKDLAAWWRSRFSIPVMAVTGSVGKTTVKEMLRSIFAEVGQGVVTHGNLNNEIGVPLTLMRLTNDDQYAVIEMGMNQAGEIGRLSAIGKPDVALVNNAEAAHLEGLGTVEAVAKAKGEIFSGLSENGIAVINADDQYAGIWIDLAEGKRVLSFSLNQTADVTGSYTASANGLQIQAKIEGKPLSISLNSLGEHSVRNALAAIAVAHAANVPFRSIKAGLEAYQPVRGRLNLIELPSATLFDDTYNANPASMSAAIQVLSSFQNTLLIVGDMAELGDSAEAEHLNLGALASQCGVNGLLACGKYSEQVISEFSGFKMAFDKQEDLITHLSNSDLAVDAILVKGSRSAKMENVVEAIQKLVAEGDAAKFDSSNDRLINRGESN